MSRGLPAEFRDVLLEISGAINERALAPVEFACLRLGSFGGFIQPVQFGDRDGVFGG